VAAGGSNGEAFLLRLSAERCEPTFRRGDADQNGRLEITDGVAILGHLFLGDFEAICLDALDVDDSGRVSITDAILLFGYLFLGAPTKIREPFDTCGVDPSPDDLAFCVYNGSCD
jgi:hypothetical protein